MPDITPLLVQFRKRYRCWPAFESYGLSGFTLSYVTSKAAIIHYLLIIDCWQPFQIYGELPKDIIVSMKSLGTLSYFCTLNFKSSNRILTSFCQHWLLTTISERLGLYTLSMEGEIPDSLYNLSNLEVLLLHDIIPGFHGSLKMHIGNLTKLTHLTLNDNALLTGTLPSELGLCEDLG